MESTNRSHLTVVLPYIGFVHMEGAYAAYEPPYGCLYSVQTTNSSGATIHWFRTYAWQDFYYRVFMEPIDDSDGSWGSTLHQSPPSTPCASLYLCHRCRCLYVRVVSVSHRWISRVTHMNESCHTYEWVVSHMWMSRVTHMNESCHTCEWVVSHMWMSRVTQMNELWHRYEWVMSLQWMSHVTPMNESCHSYEWVMSHVWMSHTY